MPCRILLRFSFSNYELCHVTLNHRHYELKKVFHSVVAQNKKQKIADYFVLNWRVLSKPIFYLLFNIYDGVKKLVAIVDTSKCKGCGLCKDECPAVAIEIVDDIAKVDNDMCVDCHTCEEVCAYNAIRVE